MLTAPSRFLLMVSACVLSVSFLAAKPRPALLPASVSNNIPQMVDGGLNASVIVFTNVSTTETEHYRLNFYGDDGQTKRFPIVGYGDLDSLTGTIAPGASVFYSTPGTNATVEQGWARTDSDHGQDVAVTQIMQIKDPATGKFSSEAAVPGEDDLIQTPWFMPFDNTNGYVSAIALACASPHAAQTVTVTIRDGNGVVLKTENITLDAFHHIAFELATRWPELANTQGTIILSAPDGKETNFTAMGLRFASVANGFTATTLPVYH